MTRIDCDIVISGASHTGSALAIALARAAGDGLSITLIDRGQQTIPVSTATPAVDVRAFALSASSRNLLTEIGVWPRLAATSCAIVDIDISDPVDDSPLRDVVLSYENLLDGGEPASVVVEAGHLRAALTAELAGLPAITVRAGCEIVAMAPALSPTAPLALTLSNGDRLTTRMLVAADGKRSRTRELAGIKTIGWSYGQSSLVTTIGHSEPHRGRALQHFFTGGPFAALPLAGERRSAIIWSAPTAAVEELIALDQPVFTERLSERLGVRLGAVTEVGPRQSYPLELFLARDLVAGRVCLVGDAARGMHPLAGQGLNVGLRDVAALAEVLIDDLRLGQPVGGALALARFQRWRRFDGVQQALTFDGINRVFGRPEQLVRVLRDAGLAVVDRLPMLKGQLVREAAGLTGDVPRLLRGSPL